MITALRKFVGILDICNFYKRCNLPLCWIAQNLKDLIDLDKTTTCCGCFSHGKSAGANICKNAKVHIYWEYTNSEKTCDIWGYFQLMCVTTIPLQHMPAWYLSTSKHKTPPLIWETETGVQPMAALLVFGLCKFDTQDLFVFQCRCIWEDWAVCGLCRNVFLYFSDALFAKHSLQPPQS